jgi:transposase-like protein
LLPTTDGNDEPESMITCSSRDKHGGAEHRYLARTANRRSRQAIFDWVRRLHGEGKTVSDIVRQTGFDRRTIAKWIRLDALPDRAAPPAGMMSGRESAEATEEPKTQSSELPVLRQEELTGERASTRPSCAFRVPAPSTRRQPSFLRKFWRSMYRRSDQKAACRIIK